MMDIKYSMKLARAFRSFERAADVLDARDLLPEVTVEQVESILYYSRPDRDTHAKNILLRMREALRVDGNN